MFGDFALFFSLIVGPLLKGREQAIFLYENKSSELSWMQSVAPKVKGKGGSESAGRNAQAMMQVVNANASAYQLKLDRLQPEGSNKLRVWVQEVSFNSIMSLLNDLEVNEGISTVSLTIDSENKPGIVSAKLVLQSY